MTFERTGWGMDAYWQLEKGCHHLIWASSRMMVVVKGQLDEPHSHIHGNP